MGVEGGITLCVSVSISVSVCMRGEARPVYTSCGVSPVCSLQFRAFALFDLSAPSTVYSLWAGFN